MALWATLPCRSVGNMIPHFRRTAWPKLSCAPSRFSTAGTCQKPGTHLVSSHNRRSALSMCNAVPSSKRCASSQHGRSVHGMRHWTCPSSSTASFFFYDFYGAIAYGRKMSQRKGGGYDRDACATCETETQVRREGVGEGESRDQPLSPVREGGRAEM